MTNTHFTLIVLVGIISFSLYASDKPRLREGEKWPIAKEFEAVGEVKENNKSLPLSLCVNKSAHNLPIFKFEENNLLDALATKRLCDAIWKLNSLVLKEWGNLTLRITEAYDQDFEHSKKSIHYEGRAADMTTSDLDPNKLGRLAYLATIAGFDWVYYEKNHVHASVRQ